MWCFIQLEKEGFELLFRTLYMNDMKSILYGIALALMTFTFPADAAAPENARTIQNVQKYLNSFRTAKARFVQTTHDGTQLVGTFYLQRPGKLKFVYDDPIKDFVVADGVFIYFYDAELKEQTNAPIGQTMADFILRDNLKLSGDVTVNDVTRSGQYLQVGLTQTDDQGGGSLILAFDEKPLQLKKWRVVDPQGLITEIELFYLETGVKHPKGFFAYHPPKANKPRLNQ